MAWNYETGREEVNAYPVGTGPLFSPPIQSFWGAAQNEVYEWEAEENKWKRSAYRVTLQTVTAKWEKAEMAILGWDKAKQAESFRRGYLEWLASSNGVASDALSDLEIEALPTLERIVARGYREMAKSEHPDTGGTKERFNKLRDAKQQLDRILAEVGDLLK